MLNNILETAKEKIKVEMNERKFIDDSDNTDRFLDKLAFDLTENQSEEQKEDFLEMIYSYMNATYHQAGESDDYGNYKGCYYETEQGLNDWIEITNTKK